MGRAWAGWAGVAAISVVATLLADTLESEGGGARGRGSWIAAEERPAARLAPPGVAAAAERDALAGLGPTAEAGDWLRAVPIAERREPGTQALLREQACAALSTLAHPTATWRAGSAPLRVAAEVADEALCEQLVGLLDVYERVVLKLPLTRERDDLVLLDAVAGAVRRVGNAAQRRRLDRWLRTAGVRDVDEETRARLRVWAEGEEP